MKQKRLTLAALCVATSSILISCDDEDKVSRLPVFDKVTLSSNTAEPGDTLKATVHFSDPGEYVKGTYAFATSPALNGVSGEFTCLSTNSSVTFNVIVPQEEESVPEDNSIRGKSYRLTVAPKRMSAFAGNSPYIDPSSMGSVSATFRIE